MVRFSFPLATVLGLSLAVGAPACSAPASRAEGDAATAAPGDDPRAEGRRVVRAFFERLEAKDLEGFLALWADDGVQIMPFAPDGFPARLDGKPAVRKQYGGLPRNFRSMRFPDLEVREMADPHTFFVSYRGEIEIAAGGTYNNTYAGLFRVEGGKIKEFREYFDPIVLTRSFGANLNRNFNAGR